MAAAGISFAKKNKGSEAAAPESEAAAEPAAEKPKRVISDEQKAKMKAGRERAAAAKKAAAAGSAPVAEAPAAVAAPVSAPAPAAVAEAEAEEWKSIKLKTSTGHQLYLWNPANNHCYNRESDGGQGEWAGIFNPKSKTIDASVPEPSDDEDFEVLEA